MTDRNAGPAPSSTDLGLLERVRARDATAWRFLVDVYGPLVHSWCVQQGLGAEDRADVVQETFMAVAAHIDGFRRDRPGDTFCGWLLTITTNKIRDHHRRQRGRPAAAGGSDHARRLADLPAAPDPPDDAEPDAAGAVLRRALDLIRADYDPQTWQAFWRTAVGGEASAAVATALGMSPNAVRKAKARILRRLRSDLEGLWP